jgi:hypothetical protein
VEVSLGSEPITSQTDTNEYSGEIFRRVIYLAINQGAQGIGGTNNVDASTGTTEDTP